MKKTVGGYKLDVKGAVKKGALENLEADLDGHIKDCVDRLRAQCCEVSGHLSARLVSFEEGIKNFVDWYQDFYKNDIN